MPASDVVFPGGVTVRGNASTADVASYVLQLMQGDNSSYGLYYQTIPTVEDYSTLASAFPSPTALNTPPLVRVAVPGDNFVTYYFFNPTANAWTPLPGFGGMDSASASSPPAGIKDPGDSLGILSLTVPASKSQRLITVSWSALINFGSTADSVELILRVNGSAVRQAIRSAPAALVETIEGPSYSFYVNPNAGFSLQTLYQKRLGNGTCTTSVDSRYTSLQYVAQLL